MYNANEQFKTQMLKTIANDIILYESCEWTRKKQTTTQPKMTNENETHKMIIIIKMFNFYFLNVENQWWEEEQRKEKTIGDHQKIIWKNMLVKIRLIINLYNKNLFYALIIDRMWWKSLGLLSLRSLEPMENVF